MQRILYKGVPMWVDNSQRLFAFQSDPPLPIGHLETGLAPNWKEVYAPVLAAWRGSLEKRPRKPETGAAKK